MEGGGGFSRSMNFFIKIFSTVWIFLGHQLQEYFYGYLAYLIFTCMYIFFVFPPIVFCKGKLQGKILGAESVMHLNAMRHYNLPL